MTTYTAFCVQCGQQFTKTPYQGGVRPIYCSLICKTKQRAKDAIKPEQECACGCGKMAKKKWNSRQCRDAWKNAQRGPKSMANHLSHVARKRAYEATATHTVLATVHRADDEEIEITQQMVRVVTPTYGLWGL
jgi:hypothetical protein